MHYVYTMYPFFHENREIKLEIKTKLKRNFNMRKWVMNK